MVRRPSRPAALSPPIPRLPPGAGNQADKLEGEDLELAKKGYLYVLGQPDSHAPTITTDGDSGVFALSVWLTHVSRCSFRWRRRERTVHARAGPCPAPPFVGYGGGRWSRPVAVADGPGLWRWPMVPACGGGRWSRPVAVAEQSPPACRADVAAAFGRADGSGGFEWQPRGRDRLWRLQRCDPFGRADEPRPSAPWTSTWATNRSVERTEWAD